MISNHSLLEETFLSFLLLPNRQVGDKPDHQMQDIAFLQSSQAHFAGEKATCDAAYVSLVNIGSGMQGLQSWSKRVGGTTEAEAHNLELVRKRLELFMREFELQSLNFESARAFFL